MNTNQTLTIVIITACLSLGAGVGIGYLLFDQPPPDPLIEAQHEAEKQYLRKQAQISLDTANYYKNRVDTVVIEREKLKTIKQYEKGLVNTSLDSLQQLLLARPDIE